MSGVYGLLDSTSSFYGSEGTDGGSSVEVIGLSACEDTIFVPGVLPFVAEVLILGGGGGGGCGGEGTYAKGAEVAVLEAGENLVKNIILGKLIL